MKLTLTIATDPLELLGPQPYVKILGLLIGGDQISCLHIGSLNFGHPDLLFLYVKLVFPGLVSESAPSTGILVSLHSSLT